MSCGPFPISAPKSVPFPCILALTLYLNAYWCFPVSILHFKFLLVFVGPDQVRACANVYVYHLLWTVGVLGPNLTDSVSLVVWHQGWWMGPWGLPWDFWQCVFTLELLYQISTNLQFSQHQALESILHAHSKQLYGLSCNTTLCLGFSCILNISLKSINAIFNDMSTLSLALVFWLLKKGTAQHLESVKQVTSVPIPQFPRVDLANFCRIPR